MLASRISLIACAFLLLLTAGCADPNRRALSVQSTNVQGERVKQVDVVLRFRTLITDQNFRRSLNLKGWDKGDFARVFSAQLAANFATRGIVISTVQSTWGPTQTIKLSDPLANDQIFSMIIEPEEMRYLTNVRYTVVVPMDSFALKSKVSLLSNGRVIWEARETVGVGPLDSTGADNFATGILNSMADSGLIAAK